MQNSDLVNEFKNNNSESNIANLFPCVCHVLNSKICNFALFKVFSFYLSLLEYIDIVCWRSMNLPNSWYSLITLCFSISSSFCISLWFSSINLFSLSTFFLNSSSLSNCFASFLICCSSHSWILFSFSALASFFFWFPLLL